MPIVIGLYGHSEFVCHWPPAGRISCRGHELSARRGGRIYETVVHDGAGFFDKCCYHWKYEAEGERAVHPADAVVFPGAGRCMEYFQLRFFKAADSGRRVCGRAFIGNHKCAVHYSASAAYA